MWWVNRVGALTRLIVCYRQIENENWDGRQSHIDDFLIGEFVNDRADGIGFY